MASPRPDLPTEVRNAIELYGLDGVIELIWVGTIGCWTIWIPVSQTHSTRIAMLGENSPVEEWLPHIQEAKRRCSTLNS